MAAVGRLHGRSTKRATDPGLPLALDLASCALRAGQPVAAAVALGAPAAGRDAAAQLTQVAGLLRLGADPHEAWQPVLADPVLAPVAHAARRSATSGARLAAGWEQLAATLRAEQQTAAQARAQRAGVLVMAPLGLCFLPAFVCLGVIPVIIGIAGALRSTW
jgi:Flp pilus assembly protein TadB